jgi:probable F420-dependent oxidoreductase
MTALTPSSRPFRFGLQVGHAPSRRAWQDRAKQAEDTGFDTILVPDHIVDDLLSPMVALATMAEATTRLHVGTFVLNNDFRHPALLAREAATVDLLTDGRLELGLGAGHAAPEYAEIGLVFDRASVRVARLEESARLLRRLFDGEEVTFKGAHYEVTAHRLFPVRRPRLLIGGNGDRVLGLGAEVADIVGFTGLGRTLPDGQRHTTEWEPERIDAKIAVARAAAGSRLDQLELNALVQYVAITDDRRAAAELVAKRMDVDPEVVLGAPFMLLGTVAEIVEQLHRARERWGFSYFVTRDADQTARIISALR